MTKEWQRHLADRVEANMFISAQTIIERHGDKVDVDEDTRQVIKTLARVFGNAPHLHGDMGILCEVITDYMVAKINHPNDCYCGNTTKIKLERRV